jgi:MFS superfamily sulfate permease-like transporter
LYIGRNLEVLVEICPFVHHIVSISNPQCVLSSIIIVSLKGLFVQFADFGKAWKSSKLDALIWISTFASVVIIDIDYGLGIGVAVSLVTLLWRNQRAYACILGEIPNTGIYVDSQRFAAVRI